MYITGRSSSNLADNHWHSVYIERNRWVFVGFKRPALCFNDLFSFDKCHYRKGARVVIDGSEKREVREPPGPVLALYLTSPVSVGTLESHIPRHKVRKISSSIVAHDLIILFKVVLSVLQIQTDLLAVFVRS